MERSAASQLLSELHAAQNAMYGGGDVAPVKALLAEDIEWHVPGDNAIACWLLALDQEAFDQAWSPPASDPGPTR